MHKTPIRPNVKIFRRKYSCYPVCGLTGLAIALPFSMVLAAHAGLSPLFMALLGLATFMALLATAMVAKILTGHETLIYFRDVIAILAVVSVIPWLFHQPVLRFLDVTILGAGVFLACGRIGCLLVGCCHGRPSRWGISYSQCHAKCGFPSHYVGVRLFPIQAVESFFVFCLVAVGTTIVWKGAPPGTALSLYVAGYAVGRFFLEFARGDADRPFLWNFSEAQWTSLLLLWALVFAERTWILPSARWHLLAAIGLMLCMGVVAVRRRLDAGHRFQLRHPHHVCELARAARQISSLGFAAVAPEFSAGIPPRVPVFETSRGIRLSGGRLRQGAPDVQHYCFSSRAVALTQREAESLARTIALLCNVRGPLRVIPGRPGIFHALLAP